MRGQLGLDLIIIIVIIMIIAVVSTISSFMFFSIFDAIETSNPTMNTTYFDSARTGIDALNFMIPLIIITMFIGIIILNYYIDAHPVFAIFSFMFLLVMTIFSATISNVFETMIGISGIDTVAARYPLITGIMSQLPLIVFIFGGLSIIVLYGKKRGATE